MLSSCYQRFSLKNYWSDIYKKQDYYELIVYLLLFIIYLFFLDEKRIFNAKILPV